MHFCWYTIEILKHTTLSMTATESEKGGDIQQKTHWKVLEHPQEVISTRTCDFIYRIEKVNTGSKWKEMKRTEALNPIRRVKY